MPRRVHHLPLSRGWRLHRRGSLGSKQCPHLNGYPKYPRFLEEDLEFKNMIERQTHLHRMQLGRGTPWT